MLLDIYVDFFFKEITDIFFVPPIHSKNNKIHTALTLNTKKNRNFVEKLYIVCALRFYDILTFHITYDNLNCTVLKYYRTINDNIIIIFKNIHIKIKS